MSAVTVIRGIGSLSAAGHTASAVWESYCRGISPISRRRFLDEELYVAGLPESAEDALSAVSLDERYAALDRTVHLAIAAGRGAFTTAGWSCGDDVAVNLGSSRGATSLLEQRHSQFLREGRLPVDTSPVTTLGNISSWVAQDLLCEGASLSHSVTCSTGLHAIGNALAWLRSGMAKRFLAGASEAPLTAFTLAQMRALRIISSAAVDGFPCRPLDPRGESRANSVVLGEGACVLALEHVEVNELRGDDIIIEGFGWGIERIPSGTGISEEGGALKSSMKRALQSAAGPVDAVVVHAPGTRGGDAAELAALTEVFPEPVVLNTPKWLIGHTFAASGVLSVEFAALAMKQGSLPPIPYRAAASMALRPRRILINATGFGGNATSVVLCRVDAR